jgi:hypothetical protein
VAVDGGGSFLLPKMRFSLGEQSSSERKMQKWPRNH